MALTLWFIGPTCDVKHQPRLETIRTHEKVSKSFLKEPPSDVILALLPVKHGYLKRFFWVTFIVWKYSHLQTQATQVFASGDGCLRTSGVEPRHATTVPDDPIWKFEDGKKAGEIPPNTTKGFGKWTLTDGNQEEPGTYIYIHIYICIYIVSVDKIDLWDLDGIRTSQN